MKKNIFIIVAIVFLFAACKKEDEVFKPEITHFELGYENSKTAIVGEDLHMDIEVVADGKINTIQIVIHPEGEHMKNDLHWEVDTTYTKFNGLKNTHFHEHLEVPIEAETGSYHFHFVVNDQEGNQTSIEDELEIVANNI